jgi:hypothetical protein
MGRGLFAVSLLLSLGCSGDADDAGLSRDTLSQRSRDSLIGASGLPGATGIRGAIKVADSAAERRRREDSVSGSP